MPPPAESPAPRAPVWLITGDKPGDNAQIEAMARALGLPFEHKRLRFLAPYVTGKPEFEASLHHIDRARSDPLEPPWPRLVLTVGRRPAMAALWIRRQSDGRSKVALLGRPKGTLEDFDLIVATAQHRLPRRANILQLALPVLRADEAAIAAAAEIWRPRLAGMARPLVALMVGGKTAPFTFDAGVGRDLIAAAAAAAAREGGSLYVTTSRRTPEPVAAALEAGLPEGARLHRWRAGDPDNPYLGLLGLADRFIVTGDSVSMMVEIAGLGRPLAICALPLRGLKTRLHQALMRLVHAPSYGDPGGGRLQGLGNLLFRLGLAHYSRDFAAVHRLLFDQGLAAPLGAPFPTGGARPDDELPRVAARLRALLGEA